MKDFLALIPAREGSKGLKGKNFLKFNKKPLIYWTIKESLKSKYINDIVVSSDSKKIKDYCKNFKKINFLNRPKKVSKDNTTMFELVNYIINFQLKKKYKYLIILQPTSPLRTSEDIDNSCKIILNQNFDSLVSVEELPHRFLPENIYKKNKNSLKNNSKKNLLINRQKLLENNKYYGRNGAAIYITKFQFLNKYLLGGKIGGYLMPQWKNVDINNYFEFKVAEYIISNKKIQK
jgi:CMP-N,N'-diacetyllegionaminic acid synthase